jgi:hypothetical protein
MSLKLRRGTNAERLAIIPAEGELIYTTDTKELYVGDGSTLGGKIVGSLHGNITENLNLGSHSITGTRLSIDGVSGNITAASTTTNLKGSVFADDSTLLVDGINGRIVGTIYTNVGNIQITGGTSGQYLRTDGYGNLSWHGIIGGSGSSNLADLLDVTINDITTNDILKWNGFNWTNSSNNLVDLPDVTINDITTNDILKWNGSHWMNDSNNLVDLPDVDILSVRTNQILSYNGAHWANTSHFVGDMSGSVFSDDSNKIIDGITGDITGESIKATVFYGNNINPRVSLTFDDGVEERLTIYGETDGTLARNSLISIRGYRGMLTDQQPTLANDVLGGISFDGFTENGYFVSSGVIASWSATADFSKSFPDSNVTLLTGNNSDDFFNQFTFNEKGVFNAPIIKASNYGTGSYPADPEKGWIIFDNLTNQFMGYNGTGWVAFTASP